MEWRGVERSGKDRKGSEWRGMERKGLHEFEKG